MAKKERVFDVMHISIGDVNKNPNNPRIIKDDKFKKLVKSIEQFPKMLEIRPIVVNEHNIILGGNMRYEACKAAGLKTIPVIVAEGLTEDEQRQFIIKDNVSGGEWDWEMLANEWDAQDLEDWGITIPWVSNQFNELNEDDLDTTEEFDPVGVSAGLQRVTFIFDGPDEAESYMKSINVEYKKHAQGWRVNMSTRFIS